MDKLIAGIFIASAGLLLILVFAFFFAFVTKLAWAYSVAEVFHLPELTFFQAFAMNVLGGMLFKGSNSSVSAK